MRKCDFCSYYDPFNDKCKADKGPSLFYCEEPTKAFIRYCNNKERSKNTTKSINKTTIKSNTPYNNSYNRNKY